MTAADDEAEARKPTPHKREIRLEDIDLDGLLIDAEAAYSAEDLIVVFHQRVGRAGFSRTHYIQVISNFERLPLSKGERFNNENSTPAVPPTRLAHFDSDPAIVRNLAELRAYTWADIMRRNVLGDDAKARFAEYASAGYNDGIVIPVSLHAGDIAVFVFLAPQTMFSLTNVAARKLAYFCHAMHARYAALSPPAAGKLSQREIEVMALVAVGKTNAEIAAELKISVHTVNTLVRRCFQKLGVSNRVEAASRLAFLTRRD